MDFSVLFKIVATVVPIAAIWKWATDRAARLKAEAVGSHLAVNEVQNLGDEKLDLRVRWVALVVRNWEAVPIRIKSVSATWPFAKMITSDQLAIVPAQDFVRSVAFDATLAVKAELKTRLLVRVGSLLRRIPGTARLRVKVVAETMDAQRRKTILKLRSNAIDWKVAPKA